MSNPSPITITGLPSPCPSDEPQSTLWGSGGHRFLTADRMELQWHCGRTRFCLSQEHSGIGVSSPWCPGCTAQMVDSEPAQQGKPRERAIHRVEHSGALPKHHLSGCVALAKVTFPAGDPNTGCKGPNLLRGQPIGQDRVLPHLRCEAGRCEVQSTLLRPGNQFLLLVGHLAQAILARVRHPQRLVPVL